jgi:glucokinase
MEELILAGDVGGTKIVLACFSPEQGPLSPVMEKIYPTTEHTSFETIVSEFLGERASQIGAACFGVAGPVKGGEVEMINVPWRTISEASLREHLKIGKVEIINDMIAMAYGALALPEDRFTVLNPGSGDARGNAALVAAGTGLGEAMFYWDGRRWLPSPSEGGHVDFGPTSELEDKLLRYMRKIFGRISVERICSGPGIHFIYKFLRDTGRGEEPAWLAERMANEDPSAVISELALAGKSPLCERTIDLFVHIYGTEAGNMALKVLATGGVFIGGGIAPKILPKMQSGLFMEGFKNKGRFDEIMEKIPVRVILDAKAPLYGAAYHAMQMLRGEA